jgi:anti-sigma factor RsiW
VNTPNDNHHLSAERLQAFLEEELSKRERHLVEEHLGSCPRCAGELEAWKVLFGDLGGLHGFRPHEGFTERVMMQVSIPERSTLHSRVRDRLAAFVGLGQTGHLDANVAQDLVDGLMPVRQAARVRRHVESCEACAHQAEGFARVVRKLDTLPRLEPSASFADEVMARVHLARQTAAIPAKAATAWSDWMVAARRLLPSTRQAWAALSGAAVTPAVTLGLVAYAVFSHPALTLGSLLSWMSWQITDLAAASWAASMGILAQGVGALGLQGILDAAAAAPMAIAGAALAYSALVVLALRVLYKNLITARSVGIRYAQVSRS